MNVTHARMNQSSVKFFVSVDPLLGTTEQNLELHANEEVMILFVELVPKYMNFNYFNNNMNLIFGFNVVILRDMIVVFKYDFKVS